MKNANLVSRWCIVAAGGAALLFTACDRPAKTETPKAVAAPKMARDHFSIQLADKVVRMQLAVLPTEMQRGLMERRDIGRDEGMLFVYDKPQQMSFWMRNTPTPLDIGFFNTAGVLEEVYPMHPFDERSVQSHGNQLRFALEMNQGWFRENGVRPGARLDVKALSAALKERGFEPRKFGLE